MDETIEIAWREPVTDEELVDLTRSHGGRAEDGWWDRVYLDSCGFRATEAALIRLR